MNFSLNYKEGVLEIENFTANKGSGSLSMYGGLDFTGRSYKEITLETNSITNDLEFPVIGTARSSINSKLVLSGSSAPFDLKGDIEIEKASFNDNVDVQREIIKYIRSRKLPDDSSITEGPVNLDINITANDSIFINNKEYASNDCAKNESIWQLLIAKSERICRCHFGKIPVQKGLHNNTRTCFI